LLDRIATGDEEVHWLNWQQPSLYLRDPVVVFHPKIEESLEINHHDASLLLPPGFILAVPREPTRGDEKADDALTKQGKQRPHTVDGGRLVASPEP